MDQLIVLSGPIGSGKSTLASLLADQYGAVVVHTRRHLDNQADRAMSRAELQAVGEELDRARGGIWVVEAVKSDLESEAGVSLVVVDAARTHDQVESLRTAFGRSVVHVHLDAPASLLEQRYERRRTESPDAEFASYEDARQNQTEASINELKRDADINVDTEKCRPEDVLVRVASRVGLFGPRHLSIVDVLVGGQFGSEGKGNVAAYLAPEYDLLVRSGGPNAGHSVWKSGGTHVQHHLPSGTTESSAMILLTAGAVLHPGELLAEIEESQVNPDRLRIDPAAMIIEEEHRLREGELTKEIGSTGSGVGAATSDRIMLRSDPPLLARDVPELRPYITPAREILEEHYRRGAAIFVEGTQGTGLSLLHGLYPHVTSRDTTASGILAEAGIPPKRARRVVMVVRTYPIRVADPVEGNGTSGPLFKELTWEEISRRSGLELEALEKQEHTTRTKRLRRVGEFDWDQLLYASMLNSPTDIALTFTDQLDSRNVSARRFDQLTPESIQFIEEVEQVTGAPVSLISTRFHQRSVIDRRAW